MSQKLHRFASMYIYIYIYIKRLGLNRLYPSRLGFGLTCRVNRVSPGQLPGGFLLRPGSVPGPCQLGSGSTCRASSGFKTMIQNTNSEFHIKATQIHHSPTLRKQYQHSLLLVLGTNQIHHFFPWLWKNNPNNGSRPQWKKFYYFILLLFLYIFS